MKNLSNTIKEFENFPQKGYVQKRPKHEPTDKYFYLERQLTKCMMRAYAFNFHAELVRAEMTGMQHITISHTCYSDKSKSEAIFAEKNLSQVYYTGDI